MSECSTTSYRFNGPFATASGKVNRRILDSWERYRGARAHTYTIVINLFLDYEISHKKQIKCRLLITEAPHNHTRSLYLAITNE